MPPSSVTPGSRMLPKTNYIKMVPFPVQWPEGFFCGVCSALRRGKVHKLPAWQAPPREGGVRDGVVRLRVVRRSALLVSTTALVPASLTSDVTQALGFSVPISWACPVLRGAVTDPPPLPITVRSHKGNEVVSVQFAPYSLAPLTCILPNLAPLLFLLCCSHGGCSWLGPTPKGGGGGGVIPLNRPQNGCTEQWVLWAPEAPEILF